MYALLKLCRRSECNNNLGIYFLRAVGSVLHEGKWSVVCNWEFGFGFQFKYHTEVDFIKTISATEVSGMQKRWLARGQSINWKQNRQSPQQFCHTRGDKAAVVLMLPGGYSLWMSGAGDNVLEIDFLVEWGLMPFAFSSDRPAVCLKGKKLLCTFIIIIILAK